MERDTWNVSMYLCIFPSLVVTSHEPIVTVITEVRLETLCKLDFSIPSAPESQNNYDLNI